MEEKEENAIFYPFEDYFPLFFEKIKEIPTFIEEIKKEYNPATSHDLYPLINERIFEPCKEELKKVMGDSLDDLLECGNLTFHTILVVYLSFADERFNNLSKFNQNILLWSALFHDIAKRGKKHFEGKDHVHPFRSAAACIKLLISKLFMIFYLS